MRRFNYYLRGVDREIVGTVVFEKSGEGRVHRGVAITGIGEPGSRYVGKRIAEGRLESALAHKRSLYPVAFNRDSQTRFALAANMDPELLKDLHKAGYDVPATEFELRILKASKK